MLGWTLGGYPSPNLQVVSELFSANSTVDEALERVAENRFGPVLAPHIVSAWRVFSKAFSEFPFKTQVVYNAPLQVGPANLLFASETGYHATMVGFPYDDLKSWRSIYPAEVFISQFEKMATGFQTGLDILKAVDLSGLKDSERKALVSEINIFETATLHFQSIANQARYILIRRSLNNSTQANMHRQQMTLKEILKNEVKLAKRLYKVQTRDSRIGFEASNHYFYVPQDLLEKIVNCRWLLSHSFSESNSQ
jgi:hypothetical protein